MGKRKGWRQLGGGRETRSRRLEEAMPRRVGVSRRSKVVDSHHSSQKQRRQLPATPLAFWVALRALLWMSRCQSIMRRANIAIRGAATICLLLLYSIPATEACGFSNGA